MSTLNRKMWIPERSTLTETEYQRFLVDAFECLKRQPQYLTVDEDLNSLELAHLIPEVPETVLAIYLGIHPGNEQMAVVNENSAVPLDLVIVKPPVEPQYARGLIPPRGSADMTTDWFKRGTMIMRKPLLVGLFEG